MPSSVWPKIISLSFVGLISSSAFSPYACLADPLADVLRRASELPSGASKAEALEGVPPEVSPSSTYGRIFLEEKVREQMFLWLGDPPERFQVNTPTIDRFAEFVRGTRLYSAESGPSVRITIVVPHPRFIDIAEMGLMKELSDLEPRGSDVASSEEMTFRGRKATMSRLHTGGVVLLFKLSKHARLQLTIEDGNFLHHVLEIAQRLDVSRFDSKLNS